LPEQFRHVNQPPFLEFSRIEFQIADHPDRFGAAPQGTEAFRVGGALAPDAREPGEERANKNPNRRYP